MPAIRYQVTHRATDCAARCGVVTTPHGEIETPVFMPVGTRATVKGLLPNMVAALGSEIILANTYHLLLRPGSDLVAAMGGLHAWMNWPRPILTDSGGFQVFSLADISRITDEGVIFKSEIDGSTIDLTPERSMQVQNELGADIIMAFDDCPPAAGGGTGVWGLGSGVSAATKNAGDYAIGNTKCADPEPKPQTPNPKPASSYSARVKLACERSIRWLDQCVKAHARKADQGLFGIVQGGTDLDQRTWCAQAVLQHDLPGYAIGGVAVGEGFEELKRVVEHTAPMLPTEKPRYLMGVGYERDILAAVRAGVDMFDCVLPTRNGRNANAFTSKGQIRLKNAQYARDPRPIEEGCDCPACGGGEGRGEGGRQREDGAADASSLISALSPPPSALAPPSAPHFSRSYLRHLFQAGEMLGPILVSLHNIRHFHRFMLDIRRAIRENDWSVVRRNWPVAEC